MTSMPCQSMVLDRIIAPWAAKIAEFFGMIVEIIVANDENVRGILHELGTCCQKPGAAVPRAVAGAVSPHDGEARDHGPACPAAAPQARSVRLPASPLARIQAAVMMDLRGKSEARITALLVKPSAPALNDAARCMLLADIGGSAGADHRSLQG